MLWKSLVASLCIAVCLTGIVVGQEPETEGADSKSEDAPARWQIGDAEEAAPIPEPEKQIVIETRVLQAPDDETLMTLLGSIDTSNFSTTVPSNVEEDGEAETAGTWSLGVATSLPVTTGTIDSAAYEHLLQMVKRRSDFGVTQAPTCSLLDGQHCEIVDGVQRPFVTDTELVVGSDGEKTFQPVVSVVSEGTLLNLACSRSENGALILTGTYEESEIVEVREIQIKAGPQRGQRLQVPVVERQTVKFSEELADGQTLVVDSGLVVESNERVERKSGLPVIGRVSMETKVVQRPALLLLTVREVVQPDGWSAASSVPPIVPPAEAKPIR